MQNRAWIVRFATGAWMAHFFGSWLEHLPQTHAIFLATRPVPAFLLWIVCATGLIAAALYAFGRFTRVNAFVLIVCSQFIFLLYFWFKEIQWYFVGILLIQILYGEARGRFSTVYWRTPFLLAIYAGFTISGLSKFFYAGWWNGDVMIAVLTNHPVGPGWPLEFVELLPYRWIGYFTLAVEVLSFPLAVWRPTRKLAWWSNTLLHFGILCWWRIYPVAVGTLIAQLLLYPGRDRDLLASSSQNTKAT